jgi:hypothetical protein
MFSGPGCWFLGARESTDLGPWARHVQRLHLLSPKLDEAIQFVALYIWLIIRPVGQLQGNVTGIPRTCIVTSIILQIVSMQNVVNAWKYLYCQTMHI